MRENIRKEPRHVAHSRYSICWQGTDGLTYSAEVPAVDASTSGIAIECGNQIPMETMVHMEDREGPGIWDAVVRNCVAKGNGFLIGLESTDGAKAATEMPAAKDINYYEVLQVSENAEPETLHRVFRIMAGRFHPDNPNTGDLGKFYLLKQAYDVLSDAARRAEYDAIHQQQQSEAMPVFEQEDFVSGIKAEANRRFGVLSLLYNQRRMDPDHPGIALLDLERKMALPREYLCFTMWYLRSKEFVTLADNGDSALTALGIDYVESNAPDNQMFHQLLLHGNGAARPSRKSTEPERFPATQQLRLPAAADVVN